MASRSLRHRSLRRRRVAAREIGNHLVSGPPAVRVSVELRDAKGIRQSFLILPNTEQAVILSGYVDGHGGFRRIELPVIVKAHLV